MGDRGTAVLRIRPGEFPVLCLWEMPGPAGPNLEQSFISPAHHQGHGTFGKLRFDNLANAGDDPLVGGIRPCSQCLVEFGNERSWLQRLHRLEEGSEPSCGRRATVGPHDVLTTV